MGGYAAYVWPAYGIFLIVLLADALAPSVRCRRALRDVRAQLARQAVRRPAASPSPRSVP